MRRQGGWTLIELMVVMTVIASVSGVVLGVAATVHDEERLSMACAQDLTGLRKAVESLEDDLRAAKGPGDLAWRLDESSLYRGDAVIARNVARFETVWNDRLVTVTLALGPRSDAPHRREAELSFSVLRRVRTEEAR